MTSPPIRTAATSDIESVGELLADAFQEPVTHWLVPHTEDRSTIMPRFFSLVADDALKAGTIHVIGDFDGAALWFDLTQPQPHPEPEAATPDLRYSEVFGRYSGRWDVVEALMSDNHPGSAHHYLMVIGVRQAKQRLGLGRALAEHHHRTVCDAAGVPAYLEATSLDSRRLYARLGYRDLRDPLQIPDGPPMYPMWRPAGGEGPPPEL